MRLFVLTLLALALPVSARAETITATINGMVCAFCATGIEKTFKEHSEVSGVHVDLESREVHIKTAETKTLSDEQVTKIISAAGYSVESIARSK